MIKSNKGNVSINGTGADLLADLSAIIRCLREDMPDSLIRLAISVGFMSSQELKQERKKAESETENAKEQLKQMLEDLRSKLEE